ncbi:MAG TPA: nicotinate phosphoribosyltransferase [Vicinamibacteria bacterium]|nr:nicotinate phosphoribosyltransferase [Vicinamibacteria bacterium]
MTRLGDLYRAPLALATDLYQLTMAQAYVASGKDRTEAAFHLFFRKNPFGGGFAVACGLNRVVDYLESFRFSPRDVEYLAQLTGSDGRPIFTPAFLDVLGALRLTCDVDAVPEGTVVFPYEPLVRVRGPMLQAQVVETALLNAVSFETLIATKAARIVLAARGDAVVEFGLRRAQGMDGGLSASRAAFVGGCQGTSNLLAGRLLGLPVKGTHAHSWVMAFDSELEAFEAFAKAQPNNAVLLVDTYDSLEGVRHAAEVGQRMRERGQQLIGVRLDSGDLAWLSTEARKILDAAGLQNVRIMASNELDEHTIESLKEQGARVDTWGVGTRLVTGGDQSALGGVYKLGAVREPGGAWQYRVKLSEQAAKISNPGVQQVRRFSGPQGFVADAIYDELTGLPPEVVIVDPLDPTRRKRIAPGTPGEDLLVPVMRGGRPCYELPPLEDARRRLAGQLAALHDGIKRFVNPHQYPVGLSLQLSETKTRLILEARGLAGEEAR